MVSSFVVVFLFFLKLCIPINAVSKWDVTKPLILTPFLNRGDIKEAQELSVTNIGNIKGNTGYFTVDEKCGNNLFFWFIKAEVNWEHAPVILWLNGGPGSSSLIGLFLENGPWDHNKSGFVNRKYYWSKNLNVIYIDQPVGTGFSFSEKNCYVHTLTELAEQMTSALFQFFKLFPILQDNNFFLTGESYAGHYIPAIAVEIDKENLKATNKINLIGVVIGNPFLDPECLYINEYLFQLGIIDRTGYDETNRYFREYLSALKSKNYTRASELYYKSNGGVFLRRAKLPNYYNILKEHYPSFEFELYVRDIETRKLMHVGYIERDPGDIVNEIIIKNDGYDPISPSIQYILNTNKYIMGFYAGQLDIVCLYSGIPCVLKKLTWSGQEQYWNTTKTAFYVNGRVAGWYKVGGNVFEVAIRNAGHLVPSDQQQVMFDFITAVVQDEPGTPLLTRLETKP